MRAIFGKVLRSWPPGLTTIKLVPSYGTMGVPKMMQTASVAQEELVLAGGCFWCLEAVYEQVRGVTKVESGYSNGHVLRPSYEEVCSGQTGHAEVVKLFYDPQQVSVDALLEIFFLIHDPTTPNRQGHDVGPQYRSGIYYTQPHQAEAARARMALMRAQNIFDQPIVTELAKVSNYWPAESAHQHYVARHPHQPYCMAVAWPKVERFRRLLAHLQREPVVV